MSRKLWNMLYDQIVQEDTASPGEIEKKVTRLDQKEKQLIQWSPTGRFVGPYSRPGEATSRPEPRKILLPGENIRIKHQLVSAQEEKWRL